MDYREKNRRRLASLFGEDLAPKLITAMEICDELGMPLYTFKNRISQGKFPQPDYAAPCTMRAWHVDTIRGFDAMLAIRIEARRNLNERNTAIQDSGSV